MYKSINHFGFQSNAIFRQWARKGYALFSSMHKVIKIGALSVIYLAFSTPANAEIIRLDVAHDTIQPIEEIEMEEVVVSAQRIPVAFAQSARIVQVIKKDALAAAPVHDLQDLLKFASNVDVRQRSGNGVQADISIRGSSFEQVLILLNGIPVNDPQTGHHNLNLPVTFDAIDRIEILEGPASRLFGPNAFSGAINIITGQSTVPLLTAQLNAGQYGLAGGAATAVFNLHGLTNNLSADYKRADGSISNTDFKIGNLFYQGSKLYPTGKIEFQGGLSNRNFGANEFYTPAYPNQFESVGNIFLSVKAVINNFLHLTPTAYWRKNQDRFELFRDMIGAPGWYKAHNYHQTNTYGAGLSGSQEAGPGRVAFGADFRSENILSTVLGNPLNDQVSAPGEAGINYRYRDGRYNLSFYGEYSLHLERLDLSAGLMADFHPVLVQKWQYYPGVDVSWHIHEALKLYVSYNNSFRMPTFTDLYYKSATNIGDPTLQPEKATSFETGLKYAGARLSAHLAIYERKGKDLIDWVRQPEDPIWHAKNLTKLNTRGLELSIRYNPELNDNKVIRSVDFSYGYQMQDKESGSFISKYLLDYLKHKFDLRINHQIIKNISAGWMISCMNRNGTYTQWKDGKYGDEIQYGWISLVDARINYQWMDRTFYLEATNLLNKKYFDYGNIELPGIWIKGGAVFKFRL